MSDKTEHQSGLNRRTVLKGAVAAGVGVWAAPMLEKTNAWASGTGPALCPPCGGITLYSKFAPGGSNTTGNQCLQPCDPVQIIAFDLLVCTGLVTVVKQASKGISQIAFSKKVVLLETAIKSQSDCYLATACLDQTIVGPRDNFAGNTSVFLNAYHNQTSTNPSCNTEFTSTVSDSLGPNTGIFTWTPDTGNADQPTMMQYDTGSDTVNQSANYIEIVMCLVGTSVIPTHC